MAEKVYENDLVKIIVETTGKSSKSSPDTATSSNINFNTKLSEITQDIPEDAKDMKVVDFLFMNWSNPSPQLQSLRIKDIGTISNAVRSAVTGQTGAMSSGGCCCCLACCCCAAALDTDKAIEV